MNEFNVGNWLVQPSRGRLVAGSRVEQLEPKTMAVLVYLATHAGQVVSADSLIEEIWNNRPLGENPVYKCVNRLRKIFGDDPQFPTYIETIPRKGYRLAVPVVELEVGQSDRKERLHRPRGQLGKPLIRVGILTAAVLFLFVGWQLMSEQQGAVPNTQEPILAVLPFIQSASEEPVPNLAGNAFSRELSSQLGRIPVLQVIAHDSVMTLADARMDSVAVAEHLGVNYLIDGEFHFTNGGLTVTGQLIDLRKGEQIRFVASDPEGDSLAIASQISEVIADALGVSLQPEWLPRCGGSRNMEACQRYRLAQEHIRMRSPGYRKNAVQLLEEAIAIEPEFAGAYAQLAVTYLIAGPDQPWPQAVAEARTAVERALELDPELPEALLAQAVTLMADPHGPCPPICWGVNDDDRAEQLARKALEQRTGDSHAHNVLAIALSSKGRPREAYSHMLQALRLDPLNPGVNYNVSLHRSWQGDQQGAEASLLDFVERLPSRPAFLYAMLAQIASSYGQYDRSLQWLAQIDEATRTTLYDALWADAFYNLGMLDSLASLLDQHRLGIYSDPRLLEAQRKALVLQGNLTELRRFTNDLEQSARVDIGAPSEWPRYLLQHLAMNHFSLGNSSQSSEYFEIVFGRDATKIVHQRLTIELDGLHMYAFSLQDTGDDLAASRILEESLALINNWAQQGYGDFPEIIAARARAHAMQGKKALAIAGLRRAFAQGWRHYSCMNVGDPRWARIATEPDFISLVSSMGVEIVQMKEQLDPHLASLH